MTAFVAFVKSYAAILYLVCIFFVFLAIKMLTDARRLSRTTLFTLDQEHAGEQTLRAFMIILGSMIGMVTITAVLAFIAPAIPIAESPIMRAPTATLVFVFPSNTPLPTLTPTVPVPTETPPFIATNPAPTQALSTTGTRLPTNIPRPALPRATPTAVPALPAPTLLSPLNGDVKIGEKQMNTSLTFKWAWDCAQCSLGPQDRFEVVVTFTDKSSGAPRMVVGNSPANRFLSMGAIIGGGSGEVYHKAKDDTYYWYVQVKRGNLALTQPSSTWKFVWH